MGTQDTAAEDILSDIVHKRNPERPQAGHRRQAHLLCPGEPWAPDSPEEGEAE